MFILRKWLTRCFKGNGSKDEINAYVDPENSASERVVEKLGFQKVEFIQEAFVLGKDRRAGKLDPRGAYRWSLARPCSNIK